MQSELHPALAAPEPKPKKLYVKRTDRDHSQKLRRGIQFAFVLLNVWIGVQFYNWVRWCESGGASAAASRPAGVEGWLPIASLMNLKLALGTGSAPQIHPAGMFLFVAFVAMSLLFRKAFCSWLCPVGTLSEYLWRAGRTLLRRTFHLPRFIDIPLRGLKYLLLSFFLFIVGRMGVDALRSFLEGPYGVVADVKMLNFFRHVTDATALTLLILVVLSMVIQNFWCRYLCPYGALMGLVALVSPARIRRTDSACIDCAKCAKACPSALPVDKLVTIKSAECIGCLECVAVCPAQGALSMSVGKRAVPAWTIAAGIAVLFFGLVGYAKLSGHWNTEIPERVYFQLVQHAEEFGHPYR